MSRATPPVIGPIPAEIHLAAQRLGLIVETYTEVVAGHGPTGRVTWAIGSIRESQGWTDTIRLRYGTTSTHENARAAMREALDRIAREREVRADHVLGGASGFCSCGTTPELTVAQHEAHIQHVLKP